MISFMIRVAGAGLAAFRREAVGALVLAVVAVPALAQQGGPQVPAGGMGGATAIPGFTSPSWTEPGDRFEARFGAFAQEAAGTATTGALNAELVSPRLPFGLPGAWSVLTPRLHGGVLGNVGGDANAAYAGLLWTIPLHERLFAEAFVGGAVRDRMTPGGRGSFQCGPSLNSGGSIGYRFSDRWSVMVTYDRMANGAAPATGSGCALGPVVNNYGARVGFSF